MDAPRTAKPPGARVPRSDPARGREPVAGAAPARTAASQPDSSRATVLVGRGLVRRFDDVTALDGVDIELRPGEAVATMGPSGSGKSTLLHCLAGIDVPDGGEVHLGATRVDQLGESERTVLRRRRFGFVFQAGHLLPELPAVENVALPLMLEGRPRREAVRSARRLFAPLGIEGLQERLPGELSGGQSQRVSIARALVVRPAVVFADEPTAALDRATGAAVIDQLVRSSHATGTALLVVTHDPEVAAACDRVVHLRDGRLVPAEPGEPGGDAPGTDRP